MATPGEGTEVPGAHYQQTMQMVADVEVGGGLWESVAGQGYRAGALEATGASRKAGGARDGRRSLTNSLTISL